MKQRLAIPLLLLMGVAIPTRAIAHGVNIAYQTTQALELQAKFDSGEPMANAQVVVYAPDNPSEPWMRGTTDEQGRFLFTPDRSIPGQWDVQVRQAGHGDLVSIPIGADVGSDTVAENTPSTELAAISDSVSGTTAISPLQKAVMAGAVIWGFIGTALFFATRKK